MWRDGGNIDKHAAMSRRRRLEEKLLKRFRFHSYIHGHNHRYCFQNTNCPKTSCRIRRVSAPTISTRNKQWEKGFLQWTAARIADGGEPVMVAFDSCDAGEAGVGKVGAGAGGGAGVGSDTLLPARSDGNDDGEDEGAGEDGGDSDGGDSDDDSDGGEDSGGVRASPPPPPAGAPAGDGGGHGQSQGGACSYTERLELEKDALLRRIGRLTELCVAAGVDAAAVRAAGGGIR
jgi:hypothetical protein